MSDRESLSSVSQHAGGVPGVAGGASGAGAGGGGGRRVETSALIAVVRERPCLWDRGAPAYRLRHEKDRAWGDVCRLLDPSYDHMTRAQRKEFGMLVCRKWANIRDSYKKYLKGTHRTNTSRPYVYAEHLSFLDAIYGELRHGKVEFEEHEADHEAEPHEWLNEVFVDMDTREGGLPQPKKMRLDYPRTKDSLEAEESIVSVLVNLIEKEEDEDRAFFKSITPTVKSLSESDKFLFRIEVMKLLDSLKKKDNPHALKERTSRESDTE